MNATISFIVPAYNEEALLGRALDSIQTAARAVQVPHEIIVVNDASTDRTAEVARAHGARVVDVQCRQIAAVRNAGAREAAGGVFIFLDADTILPEAVLRAALQALQDGAVAGGARVTADEELPLWGRLFLALFTLFYFRLMNWAAGCFVFARREVFEKAGGFDERYFASEEVHFSQAAKRFGKFVVVKPCVISSNRKLHIYSPRLLLRPVWLVLCHGPRALQRREGLEMWYDGRR